MTAAAKAAHHGLQMHATTLSTCERKPHRTYGLAGCRTTRTRNTADRNGMPRTTASQSAARKFGNHRRTDCALLTQGRCAHAEIALLGLVAVTHPTGHEPFGTAGKISQAFCQPTTGARFGGGHRLPGRSEALRQSANVTFDDAYPCLGVEVSAGGRFLKTILRMNTAPCSSRPSTMSASRSFTLRTAASRRSTRGGI